MAIKLGTFVGIWWEFNGQNYKGRVSTEYLWSNFKAWAVDRDIQDFFTKGGFIRLLIPVSGAKKTTVQVKKGHPERVRALEFPLDIYSNG